MATYGEGEPTDNANRFSCWVKNDGGQTEESCLAKVNFSVFGLGNKQYEHYNRMGKVTNALLEKLGGQRCFEYGEGDDDGSLEEDFEAWKSKLWPSLLKKFHPAGVSSSSGIDGVAKKVSLQFTVETIKSSASIPAVKTSQMNASTRHLFTAPLACVLVNKELRNKRASGQDDGSTRHIEIDLRGSGLRYETADNLAVLPENDEASVAALARALGYNLDDLVSVTPLSENGGDFKYSIPNPCTVRDILTRYYDIKGLPRVSTVAQLLPYVTDRAQAAWLSSLLRKEKRAHLKAYIEDNGKSIADLIVNELSAIQLPLVDFLHIMPHMQPRYYTISSSSSVHPDSVHITVSVTAFALKSGRPFRGLCSGYLQDKAAGSKLRIFVRASSFRLPKSLGTPVVMIGPGTGIAPMRALLQERQFQSKKENVASSNTLYFGCKSKSADYIYEDELSAFVEDKTLGKLHLAFSRDQQQKVYVQHLMMRDENAKALMHSIDQGGYVFVCGATSMGTDVLEALCSIVMTARGTDRASAADVVKGLQAKGRYVQELWS